VQLSPGTAEGSVAADTVIEHVKSRLSSYKAPRQVRFIETIGRSPSGKVDYARHKAKTTEWLGVRLG